MAVLKFIKIVAFHLNCNYWSYENLLKEVIRKPSQMFSDNNEAKPCQCPRLTKLCVEKRKIFLCQKNILFEDNMSITSPLCVKMKKILRWSLRIFQISVFINIIKSQFSFKSGWIRHFQSLKPYKSTLNDVTHLGYCHEIMW